MVIEAVGILRSPVTGASGKAGADEPSPDAGVDVETGAPPDTVEADEGVLLIEAPPLIEPLPDPDVGVDCVVGVPADTGPAVVVARVEVGPVSPSTLPPDKCTVSPGWMRLKL
jgi:hypothetical protein